MDQNSSFIKVSDLAFSYNGKHILREVNLSLTSNKTYAIIGPNGGGKTTFLHLLMGLLHPLSGTIKIQGMAPRFYRDKIGYVPQTPRFDKLFPLTVEELVLMGALHELPWWGRWKKATKQRARELIDLVGLADKIDQPIGQLSGGQIQRAYIARAMLSKPKLFLLDEPTANLDPDAESHVITLLRQLKTETTLLIVTHELENVVDLADQVLCIQNDVCLLEMKDVCHHYSMGVYHPPDAREGGGTL